MSFLRDLLRPIASDYIYGFAANAPGDPSRAPVQKEGAYVSIFLRSMRIVNVRKLWNKFYPVVHSYISLPHLSGQLAEFQAVTSPSRLAELDADNLDRVINVNHRLLGPAPYRGGDLTCEIGLFSVKSTDLAKPFLGVLEAMASAAGVSYVSLAKPFVAPLKKGVELLTGSSELSLEIGLATTFDNPETGYFFVMRTERHSVNPNDLRIDSDLRLVDQTNRAVRDYPYFVFSIESSDHRDDWFLIPELSEVYTELREATRKGKIEAAQEVFSAFKRIVLTSPDLLPQDATDLVRKIGRELTAALPTAMTSATQRELPPLESIRLYDRPE